MSEPIRVLQVIGQLTLGGAERQLVTLVERSDPARTAHVVAVVRRWGPLGDRLRDAGHDVRFIGKGPGPDPRALTRLGSLIRELRPHVVHTWLFTANLWGRLAGLVGGVPVVIGSERGLVDGYRRPWQARIERFLAVRGSCVIANSCAIKDYVCGWAGIPPELVRVIYNGVDLRAFADEPAAGVASAGRAELGLPDGVPVVGTVGRLHPIKDQATFLRAAALVREALPECVFLLVGGGEAEGDLRELARSLGVSDSVVFAGARTDVGDLLHLLDCFCLTSLSEGLPNTVLEAMAAGLPVVATAAGGTCEAVEEGRTGYLVPVGDAEALAARVIEVLGSPELSHRLGDAGRRRVESVFGPDRYIAETEALYRELLGEKG